MAKIKYTYEVGKDSSEGGFSDFFRQIEAYFERGVSSVRDELSSGLDTLVRNNIANGINTGRYSTRGGWFSLKPGGRVRAENRLKHVADRKRRLPDSRAPKGIAGAGYFSGGYAQYRAAYRSEPVERRPVNFEFSGEMMRNLHAVARRRAFGQVSVYLGFKRQQRYGGGATNSQIAALLARRGGGRNPWEPAPKQTETMMAAAIKRMAVRLGGQ